MKPEMWKQLGSWPYHVSSYGNVRHAETEEPCRFTADKDGYLRVFVNWNGKFRCVGVHILVCSLFNGKKPFKDAQVRHLDGTTDNNYYENLCWGTCLENHDDRRRHGNDRFGEKASRALFTNVQAEEIRDLYATGKYTQVNLARMFRTRQGVISGIVRRAFYNAEGVPKRDFTQRGEARHNARFTEDDVREIRALYLSGNYSQYALAHMYGVLQATISKILLRKTWKHID